MGPQEQENVRTASLTHAVQMLIDHTSFNNIFFSMCCRSVQRCELTNTKKKKKQAGELGLEIYTLSLASKK